MNINDDVMGLPGAVRSNIFDIREEQRMARPGRGGAGEGAAAAPGQLSPEQIHVLQHLSRMAKMRPKTLTTELWGRRCPIWDSKNDKDDKLRKEYEDELAAKRAFLGNRFTQVKRDVRRIERQNRHKVPQGEDGAARLAQEAAGHAGPQAGQRRLPVSLCIEDVFHDDIPISQFLRLFSHTYDYMTTLDQYLGQFQEIGRISRQIRNVCRSTHRERLVYRELTAEGRLRARQLGQADKFNAVLSQSFDQFTRLCCGSFYCPDKYFKMAYQDLPERIQKLLTV